MEAYPSLKLKWTKTKLLNRSMLTIACHAWTKISNYPK